MKDLEYKPKCFRLHENTYQKLKKLKGKQSWNLFLLDLIKNNKLK